MNPREFCKEREFPLTLALTYSFDPVFFERVVHRDLAVGGSSGVLVVADREQIENALTRPSAPLWHLGRRYVLAPGPSNRRLHAKLVLRLGRSGGLVWIGSGNLTWGGWGGNREVAAAWRVGPGSEDEGGWILPLLREVGQWAASPAATPLLARMHDAGWLTENVGTDRVLLSIRRSLSTQLQDRWRGRRFDEVRVLTGSTDRTGEMLRWAHRVFGIERATIALNPSMASLDQQGIADLPVELRIAPVGHGVLHAKLYHFTGPDGEALVVGSPNCSAAAWLQRPERGGNIELALVHDTVDRAAIGPILELVNEGAKPAGEILPECTPRVTEDESAAEPQSPPHLIDHIAVDADWHVEVAIGPPVSPEAEVTLLVDEREVDLHLDDGVWRGILPESVRPRGALLARVRIGFADDRRVTTAVHWMDVLPDLHSRLGAGDIARKLGELQRQGTSDETLRVLQELAPVAMTLVDDAAAFPDAVLGTRNTTAVPDPHGQSVRRVDPARLIRDLSAERPRDDDPAGVGGSGLGFGGLIDLLLGSVEGEVAEAESTTVEIEPETEEEADESSTSPSDDGKQSKSRTIRSGSSEHVDKIRRAFRKHLDEYLNRLERPQFRESCTATQLVQAVAYALIACAIARKFGWLDEADVRERISRMARLLLHGSDHENRPSLLSATRARYEAEGKNDRYRAIVGNGTLWIALIAAIASVPWPAPFDALRAMLFLRDMHRADDLVANASNDRISALARRYSAGEAVERIKTIALPAVLAIEQLETAVVDRKDPLKRRQKAKPPNVEMHDLLYWNDRWMIARGPARDDKADLFDVMDDRNVTVRYPDFTVVVRAAAEASPDIARALAAFNAALVRVAVPN